MNVDGAFILCGNTQEDLSAFFVDNSMQIFLRYISLRIWEDVYCTLSHGFKKNEQMVSNSVSDRISSRFGL